MNTDKISDDVNEICFCDNGMVASYLSPFLIKIHTEIFTIRRYIWELLPNNLEVGMDRGLIKQE